MAVLTGCWNPIPASKILDARWIYDGKMVYGVLISMANSWAARALYEQSIIEQFIAPLLRSQARFPGSQINHKRQTIPPLVFEDPRADTADTLSSSQLQKLHNRCAFICFLNLI